jgi:hypothetical protein
MRKSECGMRSMQLLEFPISHSKTRTFRTTNPSNTRSRFLTILGMLDRTTQYDGLSTCVKPILTAFGFSRMIYRKGGD